VRRGTPGKVTVQDLHRDPPPAGNGSHPIRRARRQLLNHVQPGSITQQPGSLGQVTQDRHDRRPAAAVLPPHPPHMPVQVTAAQQGQQRMLGRLRRTVTDALPTPAITPARSRRATSQPTPMASLAVR
jgi:hypothetical protein